MEGLSYVPEDMMFSLGDVTKTVFNNVLDVIQESKTSENEETGRFFIPFFSGFGGGCNDAFSGFGFLAFLLALLDLILELSNDNNAAGGGRRFRRDSNELKSTPEIEEASIACYSMYRGFINALSATENECAKRFLCEGAHEASSQGHLGKMIATVASENAASWLKKDNSTLYKDVAEGGFVGADGGSCSMSFSQCFSLHPTYRYPRIYSKRKRNHHTPP